MTTLSKECKELLSLLYVNYEQGLAPSREEFDKAIELSFTDGFKAGWNNGYTRGILNARK